MSNPKVDELTNLVEYFVHLEDVRRAQPGWEPRELPDAVQGKLWSALKRSARLMFRKSATGIVLIGGGGDPGTEIRDAARPEVARLLASGELTLPIQATYPLEDTAEAHREGLTGHTRGKLVIVP